MSGFFDKLKPQPKVNTPPTTEPVVPLIETSKPVEIIPLIPTPEFSNPQPGTPFETPLAIAKKYYEAIIAKGEVSPEIQAKMAAFTEISGILADGWKAEQETNATAERANSPSEKLKNILITEVKGSAAQKNIENGLNMIISKVKTKYDQQKLVGNDPLKEDFGKWLEEHGGIMRINLGNLLAGRNGVLEYEGSNDNSYPNQSHISTLKSLGVIPPEAPNQGQFPEGKESEFLVNLLKLSGKTEERDNLKYKVPAKDFINPTKIDGVSIVTTFNTSYLERGAVRGYPGVIDLNLKLSPEFYKKSLGVNPPEELSTPSVEKSVE